MSDIEHKSMTVKELSDEGSLSAVISTFQKDRDGDVMTREAFAGSDGKEIPMVWSHNWDQPVGKGVVRVGESAAEFHGQFNRDTDAGEQAYRTVKAMGDLQQYSIGFRIIDSSRDKKDGETVRTINDIELFEASPVLVGAAYGTGTIAIKSAMAGKSLNLPDGMSVNDLRDAIEVAIRALPGMDRCYCWCRAFVDGVAIVSMEAGCFKYPFSIADDKSVTITGMGVEVVQQTVWVEVEKGAAVEAPSPAYDELKAQVAELRAAFEAIKAKSPAMDIPDLETPARQKQRSEIDALLSTVKLEGTKCLI